MQCALYCRKERCIRDPKISYLSQQHTIYCWSFLLPGGLEEIIWYHFLKDTLPCLWDSVIFRNIMSEDNSNSSWSPWIKWQGDLIPSHFIPPWCELEVLEGKSSTQFNNEAITWSLILCISLCAYSSNCTNRNWIKKDVSLLDRSRVNPGGAWTVGHSTAFVALVFCLLAGSMASNYFRNEFMPLSLHITH